MTEPTNVDTKVKPPKKPRRVLSLDGGGIRGLMLLEFLIHLEQKTGKRVYQLFDTIVGTSTGGLVTILLTIPCKKHKGTPRDGEPLTAQEAKDAYLAWAQRIFPKALFNTYSILISLFLIILGFIFSFWLAEKSHTPALILQIVLGVLAVLLLHRMFSPLFTPFYKRDQLIKFIAEYYDDDTTLRHARTTVGICATIVPYGEAFLFNSMRAKLDDTIHNSRIAEIAAATSAAPTYFPPVEIDLEKHEESPQKWNLRGFLNGTGTNAGHDHDKCEFDNLPYWSSTKASEPLTEGKFLFEDGGTSSNNPSKLGLELDKAVLRVQGLKYKEHETKLLSIGTGTTTGEQDDPTRTQKSAATKVFGVICCLCPGCIPSTSDGGLDNVVFRIIGFDPFQVSINSYNTHVKLAEKFTRKKKDYNYVRFQFKVTGTQLAEMDNTSHHNMETLLEAGRKKLTPRNLASTYILLGLPVEKIDESEEPENGLKKDMAGRSNTMPSGANSGEKEPLITKKTK